MNQGDVPDDPFWPPPPEEMETVTLGAAPFILVTVHGAAQFPPPHGREYGIEVMAGGGVVGGSGEALLRMALECLTIGEMGVTASGHLVRRLSAPPAPPKRPRPPEER